MKKIFHLDTTDQGFSCLENENFDPELKRRANGLLGVIAKTLILSVREMNESKRKNKMKIIRCFMDILMEDFPYLLFELDIWMKFINRERQFICLLMNGDVNGNLNMINYEPFKSQVLLEYRKHFDSIERVSLSPVYVFRPGGPRIPVLVPPFQKLDQLPLDLFTEVLFISLSSIFPKVTQKSLARSSRKKQLVAIRRMVFSGCASVYGKKLSLSAMGNILNQNHATVFHALREHTRIMEGFGHDARWYQDHVTRFFKILFKNVEESLEMNTLLSFEEGLALVTEGMKPADKKVALHHLQNLAMKQRVFPKGFFLHMKEEKNI